MTELHKQRIAKFANIDLYPVITSDFCNGRDPVEILKAIADGGAKVVQMREKNITKLKIAKFAEKFRDITSQYNMLLIINDDLDLALSVDADGVHLGQDDLSPLKARELAPDLILGVSTHSVDEALKAVEEKASYINIGPIFATGTKSLSMDPLGIDSIHEIAPLINIPFTVMGGIKERHIKELVDVGATRIAMVTEITQAENVEERVKELRKLF